MKILVLSIRQNRIQESICKRNFDYNVNNNSPSDILLKLSFLTWFS